MRGDANDLIVLEVVHLVSEAVERDGIGCDGGRSIRSDTGNERRHRLGRYEFVPIGAHGDDGIESIEAGERIACRVQQRTALGEHLLDQMSDNLTVRFRTERMPARLQFCLELAKVLNDAVVDHGNRSGAVQVRVGIGGRHATVRCPPGVTEPSRRRRKIGNRSRNLSRFLLDGDSIVCRNRNTPGIVSPVFERLEGIENLRANVPRFAHVSKNAAH